LIVLRHEDIEGESNVSCLKAEKRNMINH